jgi:hypothetical protein
MKSGGKMPHWIKLIGVENAQVDDSEMKVLFLFLRA